RRPLRCGTSARPRRAGQACARRVCARSEVLPPSLEASTRALALSRSLVGARRRPIRTAPPDKAKSWSPIGRRRASVVPTPARAARGGSSEKNRSGRRRRFIFLASTGGAMDRPLMLVAWALAARAHATPACPIELGAIEDAKPNKLYLYFPPADDPAFPAFGT